jgi:hypothetical protein
MDFEGEGRPLFLNQAISWSNISLLDGIWIWSFSNTNADFGIL